MILDIIDINFFKDLLIIIILKIFLYYIKININTSPFLAHRARALTCSYELQTNSYHILWL